MPPVRAQRMQLPSRPASAAEARRFLQRALAGRSARLREVGVLLGSELVTNALLYAPGTIELRVDDAEPDRVRVTVHDQSPEPVAPRRVGIEATSGRGLALVEELAEAWGVELIPDDGKEVWFELAP